MNVEQLAAIITQFQADLSRTKLVSVLNKLIGAFNNLLKESTEAHQIAFNSAREALNELLENTKPFIFPNTWRRNLEELGIEGIVGDRLYDLINDTFDKNVLTPVVARDTLTHVQTQINEINEAFTNISSGFRRFKIEPAMLTPGDAELSVLIPQSEIDSDLESFAKEVSTFRKTITIISELVTGSVEPPKLKRLSNIDPWILVEVFPAVVLGYLGVVAAIQVIIQKSYGIREARAKAEGAGIHAKILKQMEEQAKGQVSTDLEVLSDQLFKDNPGSKARTNVEFKLFLNPVLEALATRLDHGYQYDGDVGVSSVDEEGQDDRDRARKQLEEKIKQIAQKVRYAELPSEPILGLPRPQEVPTEETDVKQKNDQTLSGSPKKRKRRQPKAAAKRSPKGG